MNAFLKLALSSCLVGAALMGNAAGGAGISDGSRIAAKTDREAAKYAGKAEKALKARDAAKAVSFAEEAVAFDPDNADYRAQLGQAYLLAGRFASAATALRDAVSLDPAHGKAALSLALAETAYGRLESARAVLAEGSNFIPAADYGLALALAGDKEGAITILEAAARSDSATPKARQNLALTYAMAGRWKEAQVTAAQDVPADQLPERMMQWARFARPESASDQVASLLGVKPMVDQGQPQRLALVAPAPAVVAEASAPAPAPAPAPVETAEAAPAVEAPAPVAEIEEARTRADDSIFFAAKEPATAPIMRRTEVPASNPIMKVAAVKPKPRAAAASRFVVQLGAFSSASRVEAAWSRYSSRSQRLSGFAPTTMAFRHANANVYRLSVGGFATRREASALCTQIRDRGGECFVRGTAGDAPVRFASRDARKPVRLASN